NIDDWTVAIPDALHKSIHPEWNAEWRDFFEAGARSAEAVKRQAVDMIERYQLDPYLPPVPY
ncbi:MAG: DUF2380 domain-containing protein, partial [Deltaproteobacteria bacterium]|nr:DUF2380 domain-containing protein [Deltaproteobacteria bacterium]